MVQSTVFPRRWRAPLNKKGAALQQGFRCETHREKAPSGRLFSFARWSAVSGAGYCPMPTVNTTRLSASLPELSRPLPSVP